MYFIAPSVSAVSLCRVPFLSNFLTIFLPVTHLCPSFPVPIFLFPFHLFFTFFCQLSSGDENYIFASQGSISCVKSDSFSVSISQLLLIQLGSPFPFFGSQPSSQRHSDTQTLGGGKPFPGTYPNSL